MKNVTRTFLAVLFVVSLIGNPMFAQKKKDKAAAKEAAPKTETEPPQFLITVTTMHINMDNKNGSVADWKALEKEYFDKVIAKNELIVAHHTLNHYFTADNSEVLMVSVYKTWSDIEKAGDRNYELTKAAWPDEKARKAYFEKKNAYYTNEHSDEIYAAYPGGKDFAAKPTKSMLFYVRKSHFSFPKNGTEKEFDELYKQYLTAVTNKNDVIKAFYPSVHAWGSDRTEFVEVFVVDSLSDIEKMFDKDDELIDANWADEAKRKEYNASLDKYFSGIHGDYIYRSVPELSK